MEKVEEEKEKEAEEVEERKMGGGGETRRTGVYCRFQRLEYFGVFDR